MANGHLARPLSGLGRSAKLTGLRSQEPVSGGRSSLYPDFGDAATQYEECIGHHAAEPRAGMTKLPVHLRQLPGVIRIVVTVRHSRTDLAWCRGFLETSRA